MKIMQVSRYDPVSTVLIALAAGLLVPGTTSVAGPTILDLMTADASEVNAAKAQQALSAASATRINSFLGDMDKIAAELADKGAAEGRVAPVQAGNEIQLIVSAARAQFPQ